MLGLRAKGRATSTRNQGRPTAEKIVPVGDKKGLPHSATPAVSEDSTLTRGEGPAQRLSAAESPDVVDQPRPGETEPGEERRLLPPLDVRLQWLIIAALETACRLGELLSLTWADINLDRKELTVRAETAKDGGSARAADLGRLAAVLEMAHDRTRRVPTTTPIRGTYASAMGSVSA